MNDRQTCQLSIVTSVAKAIEIYPLTLRNSRSGKGNDFLHGWEIEFHKPNQNKARIVESGCFAPVKTWFLLFDEAEKELMEDEYNFYGVEYATSIKLAKRRVSKFLKKTIIPQFAGSNSRSVERILYQRDSVTAMARALEYFKEEDEVTLSFVISEFPSVDEAKNKDYIKEFEQKILKEFHYLDDSSF